MENSVRPCRRSDVLDEVLADGSAVLYDPRTELAYPITASAAIVWETCDGVHTPAEMVEDLGSIFDAPADVIERDVHALLRHFSEIGLLETPVEGTSS